MGNAQKKSLSFLSGILDIIPNPVFVKDGQHRWVFLNDAFCKFIGHPLESLLGKSDHDFFPRHQAEVFWEKDEAVFNSGLENVNEEEFTNAGGIKHTILTKKTRYINDEGHLFLVGIITDITERKRMEAELSGQADFQRTLLSAMSEAGLQLMVIENARVIHVGNRELARQFGFTDAQLDAHPALLDFIHPDDRARVAGTYRRRIAGEPVPTSYELGLITPGGERCEYETSVAIVPDSNPVRVVTIGKDVSARKQAEKLEQFRSHTLELLSSSVSLGTILESIVRGVELLNSGMICSILLLDSQGKQLVDGVAPSLPDFYNAAIDGLKIGMGVGSCGTAAFSGERVIVDDIKTHPYWVSFKELAARAGLGACWSQPILSSSGQVLGTFAIYHRDAHSPSKSDISMIEKTAHLASIAIERKRADVLLATREREYRTLAENSPDTIARYDRECRFVYVNPLFEKLRGVSLDELSGKTPMQVPGLPDAELFQQRLREVIATGKTDEFELSIVNHDGTADWRMSSIVPEFDARGQVVNLLVLSRNITSLKEAGLKLEESRARLRQLLEHHENTHEQERKIISWNLHEDLLQTLAALKMCITMLQSSSGDLPAHFAKTLETMLSGANQSIFLARETATALRPTVLNLGIRAALEWLVDEFVRQSGRACKLEVGKETAEMDEKYSIAIFRIAQESFAFSAKYKSSAKMNISLKCDERSYLLTISDKRKQSNIEPTGDDFLGLHGLQEHVMAMGGEMVASSPPNYGLIVEARLPFLAGGQQ